MLGPCASDELASLPEVLLVDRDAAVDDVSFRTERARAVERQLRAPAGVASSTHLLKRAELLAARTNQVWPSTHCPYCQHLGVTRVDFASHRQASLAWCLTCHEVWIPGRGD